MKINQYADYKLGKVSFLHLVCEYLMSLDTADVPNTRCSSRGSHKRASLAQSACLSDFMGSWKSTGSTCSELEGSSSPIPTKEMGWLQKLDLELRTAKEVFDQGLGMEELKSFLPQVAVLDKTVSHWLANERQFFETESEACSVQQRLAELKAWNVGRRRLRELREEIGGLFDIVQEKQKALLSAQTQLQEFAALRPAEFGSITYLDIFKAVFMFISRMKDKWAEIKANTRLRQEVLRPLANATPLAMLFQANGVKEAANIWRIKSTDGKKERWTDEDQAGAIQKLFALFDSDLDGAIDAGEIKIVLEAYGIRLMDEREHHLRLVHMNDTDGSGVMEMSEFTALVVSRVECVFIAFHADVTGSITKADLETVNNQYNLDFSDKELTQMLAIFPGSRAVSLTDFMQIVLMPLEKKVIETVAPRFSRVRFESAEFFLSVDEDSDSDSDVPSERRPRRLKTT